MTEKNFKEAVAFSRNVIPESMRRLVLAGDDGLVFLGRENLQSMIDEWKLVENAAKVTIAAVERMNREYDQSRSTEFYKRQASLAKTAQKKLTALRDEAESKPLFCDLRKSPQDFKVGDEVFCLFDDGSNWFSKCTVTGYKDKEVVVSVEVYDDDGNELLDEGSVAYDSQYFYSISDMKYLALHPEYFSLFVSYLGFEADDAQILFDMIEDCVLYYFPETEAEILRLAKEMEEDAKNEESAEASATQEAT